MKSISTSNPALLENTECTMVKVHTSVVLGDIEFSADDYCISHVT